MEKYNTEKWNYDFTKKVEFVVKKQYFNFNIFRKQLIETIKLYLCESTVVIIGFFLKMFVLKNLKNVY